MNDAFETPADPIAQNGPATPARGRAKPELKSVAPTPQAAAEAPQEAPRAPAAAPAARTPPIEERILIRRFVLVRDQDESGTSGVGVVAEGVEFTDGTCVLRWRSIVASTVVYDSLKAVDAIHGHGGKTRIAFVE